MKAAIGIVADGDTGKLRASLAGVRDLPTCKGLFVADWTDDPRARVEAVGMIRDFASATGIPCFYSSAREIRRYARTLGYKVGDVAAVEQALLGPEMAKNLLLLSASRSPILLVDSGCSLVFHRAARCSDKKVSVDTAVFDPTEWAFYEDESAALGERIPGDFLAELVTDLVERGASAIHIGYAGRPGFASGYPALFKRLPVAIKAASGPSWMHRAVISETTVSGGYLAPGPVLVSNAIGQRPFLSSDRANSPGGADAGAILFDRPIVYRAVIARSDGLSPMKSASRVVSLFDIISGGVDLGSAAEMDDGHLDGVIREAVAGRLRKEAEQLNLLPYMPHLGLGKVIESAKIDLKQLAGLDVPEERKRLRDLTRSAGSVFLKWNDIVRASVKLRDKFDPPIAKVTP